MLTMGQTPKTEMSVAGLLEQGRSAIELGRIDAALEALLQAQRAEPENREVRFELALALIDNGQPDLALPDLETFTATDPENADYWLARARALTKRGQTTAAIRILEGLVADTPDYLLAFAALADAYCELERPKEWLPLAMRLHEIAPDHPLTLLWLGRASSVLGEAERAEQFLLRALASRPTLTAARVELGRVLRRRGEDQLAELALEEAHRLAPWDGDAEGARAAFLLADKRPFDLVELQKKAAELPYRGLLFHLGKIRYELLDDVSGAIAALESDVAARPESVPSLLLLGTIHLSQGDDASALGPLAKIAELSPEHGVALRALAVARHNTGDSAGAKEAYERAIHHLQPGYESAHAHFGLSVLLRELGETEAADRELALARLQAPDDPTIAAAL